MRNATLALPAVVNSLTDSRVSNLGAFPLPTSRPLRQIALLGTFPPRQCGIATYTADVMASLKRALPRTSVFAIAVSNGDNDYDYPPDVALEIRETQPESYREAADYLNGLRPDVLWVQHEYGIFGGEDGAHLLALIEACEIPVVTTFHTVVAEPSSSMRAVTLRILRASARILVMTRIAADLLRELYHDIALPPIEIIPHGIPDFARQTTEAFKVPLDLSGRFTLLTFGLLSPGKGIEYAIDAMPEIVRIDPTAVYVILGATHPCLVKREGESYREDLIARARELGVGENVRFVNEYVDVDRLTQYLGAADVYITPYLNEAQITSGTLAYASGSGCPVVSTPYWHARELITPEKGFLVPFGDSDAIARAVITLVTSPELRVSMREEAYRQGRATTWAEVGERFALACATAATQGAEREAPSFPRSPSTPAHRDSEMLIFPFVPSLKHLRRMTTPLGIWQHARLREPDTRHGFCTDDNARALVLACRLLQSDSGESGDWRRLAVEGFRTLESAFNSEAQRFRNFRHADGQWLEAVGSPDSHGRALWACGIAAATKSLSARIRPQARHLLLSGLATTLTFPDLRPAAFATLGVDALLESGSTPENAEALRTYLKRVSNKLRSAFEASARRPWRWFEERLTYDNAKLPHALILVGSSLGDEDILDIGLDSLRWLMEIQTAPAGHFRPIGSNGWCDRETLVPAQFDQQPLEAFASTSACLAAARATDDSVWLEHARRSYRWFLGDNDLGAALYDPSNGGVFDGLHPDRVNGNQGSESLLSFHLAHAELSASSAAPLASAPPVS